MVVVTTRAGPGALSLTPSPWNCCAWPLRRRLRVFWLVIVTAIFFTLPMLIMEMQKQQWATHYKAWFLAGLFSLLSLPVCLYEVALHLEYFSNPALQRHILRIMFMPPIYALDSWFCLRFIEARTLLTPIRECYEAYTIYNFFMYLIRYLEGQVGTVPDYMAAKGSTAAHFCGVQYLSHQWVGKELYRECRKGVLNYVILRPATSAVMWITLVCNPEKYEEGVFAWNNVWPYITVINNFSQCWALYVLMLFYVAMHEELKALNPLRKFVTIKLVVFFSFWQGLFITLAAASGMLRANATWRTYNDTADLAGGLQDFIICIEMFFASIGFAWAFPPRDYMTGEPPGFWKSFTNLFDFRDVVDDVQDRVNEEYREITTRPIQKILQPLRNNPLFSKGKTHLISLQNGVVTELMPLQADVEAGRSLDLAGDVNAATAAASNAESLGPAGKSRAASEGTLPALEPTEAQGGYQAANDGRSEVPGTASAQLVGSVRVPLRPVRKHVSHVD